MGFGGVTGGGSSLYGSKSNDGRDFSMGNLVVGNVSMTKCLNGLPFGYQYQTIDGMKTPSFPP